MNFKNILRFMARTIIRRRRPIIVGITGSNASLTREAITIILSKNYFVHKTEGDNVNEIDILLTIIDASSFSSAFFRWFCIMVFPLRYPDVIVLEMNFDNLEDMESLMNVISVNVAVATRILPEHKEQGKLLTFLPGESFAIFNIDDQIAVKIGEKTKAKIITYGFSDGATLLADNLIFHKVEKREEIGIKEERGFSFKLNYEGNTIPLRLPKIAAPQHLEPVLASAAVGIALKMNLVEIVSVLES